MLFKSKSKNISETSKAASTVNIAFNTMEKANETVMQIKKIRRLSTKIMEKLKKIMARIYGNKHTLLAVANDLLISTTALVTTYTDYLYQIQWFKDNELVLKIAAPILVALLFGNDLWIYIKRAFDSNKSISEIKTEKIEIKKAKLPAEVLTEIKGQLKLYKTQKVQISKEIETCKADLSHIELFVKNGVATNEQTLNYEKLKQKIALDENVIANCSNTIIELEKKLLK